MPMVGNEVSINTFAYCDQQGTSHCVLLHRLTKQSMMASYPMKQAKSNSPAYTKRLSSLLPTQPRATKIRANAKLITMRPIIRILSLPSVARVNALDWILQGLTHGSRV